MDSNLTTEDTPVLKYLKQDEAAAIDADLMSEEYGFSIDQLMELAGLSVANVVYQEFAPETFRNVLLICGPGNNGGDALVASRHLKHFGYNPSILYPKVSDKLLLKNLVQQNLQLEVPFLQSLPELSNFQLVVDGIFGFSFKGDIRPPFDTIISQLNDSFIPIVSIDIPSGWNVEQGNETGKGLREPEVLVSLTAPKLCARKFRGTHYLGGRFIPTTLAKAYELNLPTFPHDAQCVKLKTLTSSKNVEAFV